MGRFVFGEWDAPLVDGVPRVDAPPDADCTYCGEHFALGDNGAALGATIVHRECHLRVVLGGAGHHVDHARFCGELGDPDGGLSFRKSSLLVWAHIVELKPLTLETLREAADLTSVGVETMAHIDRVQELLREVTGSLTERGRDHDASKLQDPERELFELYTPKLRGCEYGSDEYRQFLVEMKPALDHHYAVSRHHPEHFENGIHGMNLVDMTEMLADWKAAGERHASGGDLGESIKKNRERFGYGDEIEGLLRNTAEALGWL